LASYEPGGVDFASTRRISARGFTNEHGEISAARVRPARDGEGGGERLQALAGRGGAGGAKIFEAAFEGGFLRNLG